MLIPNKIANARKRLDDFVLEKGNAVTPKSIRKIAGLGSILTTDLSFRLIGASVGVLSPFAGMYALSPNFDPYHITQVAYATMLTFLGWPLTLPFAAAGFAVGALTGADLDSFVKKQYNKIAYLGSKHLGVEIRDWELPYDRKKYQPQVYRQNPSFCQFWLL